MRPSFLDIFSLGLNFLFAFGLPAFTTDFSQIFFDLIHAGIIYQAAYYVKQFKGWYEIVSILFDIMRFCRLEYSQRFDKNQKGDFL